MTMSTTPVEASPSIEGDARRKQADDESAVRATVLDYFEGWFDGDVERMKRALHPQLAKRSFAQDPEEMPVLRTTTADQMAWFTEQANGRTSDPVKRELSLDVVEVSGGIATVVVHSYAYIEYLHVAATREGWRIVNSLWRYADGRGPKA